MFCPTCGVQNERDAKKCSNCGKPLPRLTPAGNLEGIPATTTGDTAFGTTGGFGANGGAEAANPVPPTENTPGSGGPKAGSPGSQYAFSSPPGGYSTPYAGYTPPPGYAPYYNYSLPVDRVGVAPAEIGFWPRLGAYVIDSIILSIISGVVFGLPLFVYGINFFTKHQAELLPACDTSAYGYSSSECNTILERILTQNGEMGTFVFMTLGLGLLAALIQMLYYTILTARGATVGKKVFGMRVVTADGQNIGFGRSLLRHTVGYFISGIVFGLGFIWIGFDPHKQGWHDKIARTYVVRA